MSFVLLFNTERKNRTKRKNKRRSVQDFVRKPNFKKKLKKHAKKSRKNKTIIRMLLNISTNSLILQVRTKKQNFSKRNPKLSPSLPKLTSQLKILIIVPQTQRQAMFTSFQMSVHSVKMCIKSV